MIKYLFLLILSCTFLNSNAQETYMQTSLKSLESNIKKIKIKNHELLHYPNNNSDSFVVQYFIKNGIGINPNYEIIQNAANFLIENSTSTLKMNIEVKDNWMIIQFSGETSSQLPDAIRNVYSFFTESTISNSDWEKIKNVILINRYNNLQDPIKISEALTYYARFGENNPFNYNISTEALKEMPLIQFKQILSDIFNAEHKILYYGPELSKVKDVFVKNHPPLKKSFKSINAIQYSPIELMQNRVIFLPLENFSPCEIIWVKNNQNISHSKSYLPFAANSNFYSNYLKKHLQDIVQIDNININAKIALSYFPNNNLYTVNQISLQNAPEDINSIITYTAHTFNNFKLTDLKDYIGSNNFDLNQKNNIFEDLRVYMDSYLLGMKAIDNLSVDSFRNTTTTDEITTFYRNNVSLKPYTLCVVGDVSAINSNDLMRHGVLKIVHLNDLFKY